MKNYLSKIFATGLLWLCCALVMLSQTNNLFAQTTDVPSIQADNPPESFADKDTVVVTAKDTITVLVPDYSRIKGFETARFIPSQIPKDWKKFVGIEGETYKQLWHDYNGFIDLANHRGLLISQLYYKITAQNAIIARQENYIRNKQAVISQQANDNKQIRDAFNICSANLNVYKDENNRLTSSVRIWRWCSLGAVCLWAVTILVLK